MNNKKVIIKKSKIHGKGLFAAQDFKKGEIVLHWDLSHVLSEEEFAVLSDEDRNYISVIKEKYILMQEPERYMNHSCAANTKVENFTDIALRDIALGEEITTNYSVEDSRDEKMKCNCGAAGCCGEI